MLQAPEVTPSLLAAFFTAASAFYRAAPWTMLDDFQPLTLQFLPEGQTWYAIILGQAKLQNGIGPFSSKTGRIFRFSAVNQAIRSIIFPKTASRP